jgi:hypothetical protein
MVPASVFFDDCSGAGLNFADGSIAFPKDLSIELVVFFVTVGERPISRK